MGMQEMPREEAEVAAKERKTGRGGANRHGQPDPRDLG